MPLVDVGLMQIPPPIFPATSIVETIDANNEVAWGIHMASKAGTISKVRYRTVTVTTPPGSDVDVRIETVNATGEPTGTLWATNTNVAHTLVGSSTWGVTNALTAGAVVAKGDIFATVLQAPSSSSGNFTLAAGSAWGRGSSYGGGPNRTTKRTNAGNGFVVEYDDGSFNRSLDSGMFSTFFTTSTTSDPEEVGIVFTCPIPMRATGAWHAHSTAGTFRLALYETGSFTPIAKTPTIDTDYSVAAGTLYRWNQFDGTATLKAGTVYRLTYLPLSGTHFVNYLLAHDVAAFDILGLGTACFNTQRARSSSTDPDSTAWDDTVTTRRPTQGLVIDQLHDGRVGGASNIMMGVG